MSEDHTVENHVSEGSNNNNPKPSVLGIVTSPIQQLERIRTRPLILAAITTVILLIVVAGIFQGIGIETPDISEIQENAMLFKITAAIGGIFGNIISILLTVLIISGIYMLIAKIAQSDVNFRQMFSMNTYAAIITAIGVVVNGIVTAINGVGADSMDSQVLATSLGSIIPAEGAISGLLNSIEIFAIWNYIVTALGLHIVGGFSKKLAWGVVIVLFVITTLFSMMSFALSNMVGV